MFRTFARAFRADPELRAAQADVTAAERDLNRALQARDAAIRPLEAAVSLAARAGRQDRQAHLPRGRFLAQWDSVMLFEHWIDTAAGGAPLAETQVTLDYQTGAQLQPAFLAVGLYRTTDVRRAELTVTGPGLFSVTQRDVEPDDASADEFLRSFTAAQRQAAATPPAEQQTLSAREHTDLASASVRIDLEVLLERRLNDPSITGPIQAAEARLAAATRQLTALRERHARS